MNTYKKFVGRKKKIVFCHRFSKNATLPCILKEISTTYTESRRRVAFSTLQKTPKKAQKKAITLLKNHLSPLFFLSTLQLPCAL
jgi:hypothetical protein